jgi:hypothetical protein
VTVFVTAGAGFLLAVLWFDLMFDVQVRHRRERKLPADLLRSISGYYGRVTMGARPMSRLIGLVMIGTLVAIVIQIAKSDTPDWVAWTSLTLAALPITLAAMHTFPAAVRLGERADTEEVQSRLARSIFRDHLLCLVSIGFLLALQLGFG